MRRAIVAFGLVLSMGAFAMLLPTAAVAKGHEQVVFSGEGEGSVGEIEFWIWCAVDPSGGYDSTSSAWPSTSRARSASPTRTCT